MYARCEVSMIKPIGQSTYDNDKNTNDNDDTRWTIHDCMDPLALMPNEPTRISLIFRYFVTLKNKHFGEEQNKFY